MTDFANEANSRDLCGDTRTGSERSFQPSRMETLILDKGA